MNNFSYDDWFTFSISLFAVWNDERSGDSGFCICLSLLFIFIVFSFFLLTWEFREGLWFLTNLGLNDGRWWFENGDRLLLLIGLFDSFLNLITFLLVLFFFNSFISWSSIVGCDFSFVDILVLTTLPTPISFLPFLGDFFPTKTPFFFCFIAMLKKFLRI